MKNNPNNRVISKARVSLKVKNNIQKTERNDEIQLNSKNKDSLQIKDQSPLLYNRMKNVKDENIIINEIKSNSVKNVIAKKESENNLDSKGQSQKKNSSNLEIEDEAEFLRKRVLDLEISIIKSKIYQRKSEHVSTN